MIFMIFLDELTNYNDLTALRHYDLVILCKHVSGQIHGGQSLTERA